MQGRPVPLRPVIGSGIKAHAEHPAQPLRGERSERLERYRQVGTYLQGDVEDGRGAVKISLGHLPRLSVGDILVAEARQ